MSETLELAERLRTETDVLLAAVVVNKVLPELFGRGEEEIFHALRDARGHRAAVEPRRAVRPGRCSTRPQLAVTLRRTRAGHLTRLRSELPPDLPLLYVPYLFTRDHGVRSTRAVAEALAAEIGY